MILQEKLELSEAFRINDIKFNRLILLLNFIFIITWTLSLRYGRNLRIHLPILYPRYKYPGRILLGGGYLHNRLRYSNSV